VWEEKKKERQRSQGPFYYREFRKGGGKGQFFPLIAGKGGLTSSFVKTGEKNNESLRPPRWFGDKTNASKRRCEDGREKIVRHVTPTRMSVTHATGEVQMGKT